MNKSCALKRHRMTFQSMCTVCTEFLLFLPGWSLQALFSYLLRSHLAGYSSHRYPAPCCVRLETYSSLVPLIHSPSSPLSPKIIKIFLKKFKLVFKRFNVICRYNYNNMISPSSFLPSPRITFKEVLAEWLSPQPPSPLPSPLPWEVPCRATAVFCALPVGFVVSGGSVCPP